MNRNKSVKSWRIILSVICALFLSCALLGYGLFGDKSADALSAVPNSTTVTDPIYDFANNCYSEAALNQMAQKILGTDSSTIQDLIDYTSTTAGEQGKPINNKEITLKYGRYHLSPQAVYRNLVWMPVYLSKSADGDAVLTLYLAATEARNGSTSKQETSVWSYGSSYSSDVSCTAPTNSYGTSYIRAMTLGNGGTYARYDTSHSGSYTNGTATIKATDVNKFSDFVKGADFTGTFYDDIVTPANMKWQADESYSASVGKWSSNEYVWPNDAYGAPKAGVYYQSGNYDYLAKDKVNYSAWKNDKVWLPSITEVGTGNITANGDDGTNGVWKLTDSQRSNTIKSWLRSAYTLGTNNTYTMFCTSKNGAGYDTDAATQGVDKIAVRPAIHLNLTQIITKRIAPVDLPDSISITYSGVELTNTAIVQYAGSQMDWYDPDNMGLFIYEDENKESQITPVDVGTYYMFVEIRDDRYFLGQDKNNKVKMTKLIINKVKMKVKWTYGDDKVPTKVEFDGTFFERDTINNAIPKLGIKYNSIASEGVQGSTEYPKIKGTYRASAYIINENVYSYNYELVADTRSNAFIVTERKVQMPQFSLGGTTLTISYRGKQAVQFINVSDDVQITSQDELEDLGYDKENKIHTFTVEDNGIYTFKVSLKDVNNTLWAEGGISDKTMTLRVEKAKLTVMFNNLPTSWESNRDMEVGLTVLGLFDTESDAAGVNMQLFYRGTTGGEIVINKNSSGKYVIPRGLKVGTYTLGARMGLNANYYMDDVKLQRFSIIAAPAEFSADDILWQYIQSGMTSATIARDNGDGKDGSTPAKAYEVSYTGNYFQFSLTSNEARLTALGVKATYSGDTYVSEGGDYKITVSITAYDRNVIYTATTYDFYFRILKRTFDLSGVRWNYSGPITFSGNENKVMLDPDTLPAGLTATYITNGECINVGSYLTSVRFAVSDDYAGNYKIPQAGTADSYTGDFTFSCRWEIVPLDIIVRWNTGLDVEDADIFFIPILEVGHSFVDYTYEKQSGSNWIASSGVTAAEGAPETYRVTASLKSVYSSNYTLSVDPTDSKNVNPYVFIIGAGKQPISVHLEVNNKKCDDGEQFVYTGNPFTARPVVDTGNLQISAFNISYYTLDDYGNKSSSPISGEPVNVGRYAAVATIRYENATHTYLSEESSNEITFEIIKADYDISALKWQYAHGIAFISASYDPEQKKWVDSDGKEVSFSFSYDGTMHRIELVGSAKDLTVERVIQNAYMEIGDYTASVTFGVDPNYNEPDFPTSLSWKINKLKFNLENVEWGFINDDGIEFEFDFEKDSFEYTRHENGDKNYRVGLINIPEELKEYFHYSTTSSTTGEVTDGNTASSVGIYVTSFTFSGTFTDKNYETFTAANIPVSLPTYVTWEIKTKTLTTPAYTGGWDEFDNRTHNLVELCGIPESEVYYYKIEITFTDGAGVLHREYKGYDDQEHIGFHAGTYMVEFYQSVNGEDVFAWRVTINVAKAKLTVVWDTKGSIPVARVSGVAVSEMLGTMYTNAYGNEVTENEILSTDGVQYYARPYIVAAYANNIQYSMRDGVDEEYAFKSSQFVRNESTVELPKPQLKVNKIEYTGRPVSFEVLQLAPGYLYISDGELTQTEVGRYYVVISFEKDANAVWEGTESNRDSLTLYFEITEQERVKLEKPTLQFYSATYTGDAITFIIENFILYRDYLHISSGSLTQTSVGIYRIVLSFNAGSRGCWMDGTTSDYVIQFQINQGDIIGSNGVVKLNKPTLQFTSATYSGKDITFIIVNWDTMYKNFLKVTGDLTKRNVGTYTVTVSFIDGAKACWADTDNDKSSVELKFYITEKIIGDKTTVRLPYPILKNNKVTYTGSEITFQIINWESIYADYLQVSGSLSRTEVGTYSITVSFKSGVDACWEVSNAKEAVTLAFQIIKKIENNDDAIPLDRPTLTFTSAAHTGQEIVFQLENASYYEQFLYISAGSLRQTDVGTYEITLSFLASASNAYWAGTDNDRSDYKLTFFITGGGGPDVPPDKPPPTGPVEVALPVVAEGADKVEFTGKDIKFAISNWDAIKNYVEIEGGEAALTKRNIGKYTIVIKLKGDNYWTGGTTDDYTLNFEITKANITDSSITDSGKLSASSSTVDKFNFDELAETVYKDMDGNVITDITGLVEGKDYTVEKHPFVEYEYRDKDGNVVDKADLVEGEEYTVIVRPTDAFYRYFTVNSQLQELLNKEHTFTYVPEPEPKNNFMLIAMIVVVVILAILIIATIIVLLRKGPDDDEDYDDDYYDDYDDYDDDYDDE